MITNKQIYKKIWKPNYAKMFGLVFGLLVLNFLSITASAQLVAARPGPYNSPIIYGNSRDSGMRAETRSYDDYSKRLSLYGSAKRIRIDEEWHDCFRHAMNAAQSKVCSDNAQRDRGDLESDLRKIQNAAYIQYQQRMYLINKYWNERS